jgi:hypothetical protein
MACVHPRHACGCPWLPPHSADLRPSPPSNHHQSHTPSAALPSASSTTFPTLGTWSTSFVRCGSFRYGVAGPVACCSQRECADRSARVSMCSRRSSRRSKHCQPWACALGGTRPHHSCESAILILHLARRPRRRTRAASHMAWTCRPQAGLRQVHHGLGIHAAGRAVPFGMRLLRNGGSGRSARACVCQEASPGRAAVLSLAAMHSAGVSGEFNPAAAPGFLLELRHCGDNRLRRLCAQHGGRPTAVPIHVSGHPAGAPAAGTPIRPCVWPLRSSLAACSGTQHGRRAGPEPPPQAPRPLRPRARPRAGAAHQSGQAERGHALVQPLHAPSLHGHALRGARGEAPPPFARYSPRGPSTSPSTSATSARPPARGARPPPAAPCAPARQAQGAQSRTRWRSAALGGAAPHSVAQRRTRWRSAALGDAAPAGPAARCSRATWRRTRRKRS